MGKLLKNVLFRIGTFAGNSKHFFWLKALRKKSKEKIINKETDICIEGFQRCGNSYFVMLFKQANKDVKIAHHLHSTIQIKFAIKNNIPCVVLIREPAESISSLITMDENLSINNAISAYINFYQPLLALKNNFITFNFKDIISDYNTELIKINKRYNTCFNPSKLTSVFIKQRMLKRETIRNDDKSSPFPNAFKKERNKINRIKVMANPKFEKATLIYERWINSN